VTKSNIFRYAKFHKFPTCKSRDVPFFVRYADQGMVGAKATVFTTIVNVILQGELTPFAPDDKNNYLHHTVK
jgi:hypothetical protein